MDNQRYGIRILDTFIDAIPYESCIQRVIEWGYNRKSRTVSICNVHVVVTANKDPELQFAVNDSDIAAPDGMPLVWTLRKNGFPSAQRVCGPDVMLSVLSKINDANNIPVFFYGSTWRTLNLLIKKVSARFPNVKISGSYSPPFRPLTPNEDDSITNIINSSGARIVFVGLGCPKQELWMVHHKGKINAVMLGVGAAFDFHAGVVVRAPKLLQSLGLEWCHRLYQEPKRLFQRYLITNTTFLRYAIQRKLMKP